VPYGAPRHADGHLIVAIFAEKFWAGFCPPSSAGWERDPRFATNRDRVAHRADLMTLIEARVRERTTEEWLARLHAAGVPRADPGRGSACSTIRRCATAAWWWSSSTRATAPSPRWDADQGGRRAGGAAGTARALASTGRRAAVIC